MRGEEDAVAIGFCCVCRRSSDLKWRKHVFSKAHQRNSAEFLAVRTAKFNATRSRILGNDVGGDQSSKSYCVFCEVDIVGWDAWVEHYAGASHRKQLNQFCQHHRCDATQQSRQQLCLSSEGAAKLRNAIMQATRRTTQPRDQASADPRARVAAHSEVFLRAAAARLEQVRESHVDRPTQPVETSHRRRESHSESFSYERVVTSAVGPGLSSIQRADWADNVANIHTAAIPPWMVESEEEYKRRNQRVGTKRPRGPPYDSREGIDIFAKLNPKYDEKTWLPKFGGVWQEGPRSKTQREFRKAQATSTSPVSNSSPTASAPGKRVVINEPAEPQLTSSEDGKNAYNSTSQLTQQPAADPIALQADAMRLSSSVTPSQLSQHNEVKTPSDQTLPTALDSKKQLLLAQKARLRAKLAAKRGPPPS